MKRTSEQISTLRTALVIELMALSRSCRRSTDRRDFNEVSKLNIEAARLNKSLSELDATQVTA